MNLWQRAGKAYKALEAHRKKARERIRELKAENARLRGVIKDAPHSLGCAGLYDKNAPTWMRPGKCNCWKRDALEKSDG